MDGPCMADSVFDRHFDVIVAGGGSSGSIAAIAAARSGARTLLVERYGFLGGISTAVLDTFYGFYTPGTHSIKAVSGIADEVVTNLRGLGGCFERPNTYGAGTGITYNPEYLKVIWEELAANAGVQLLLHAWIQDAQTANGRIQQLVVATRAGLRRLSADFFIDATGEADICHYAGAPYEAAGQHEPAQSLTTTFKVVNVDAELRKTISKQEFHERMAAAAESGEFDLPRREGSDHVTTIPGMMATNMTRVPSSFQAPGVFRNATDPEFFTEAEIEGRRQALEYLRFLRARIPGYAASDLVAFSTQLGVRESRRIFGEYRLTREDVLSARQFEDQIGLCGAPIEDHQAGHGTRWQYLPDGSCVGIPFRCLLPLQLDNLLVCGRCFSASHDAHAAVRSMAQCMAMGQAAGTAAAFCALGHLGSRELNVAGLQQRLSQDRAVLTLENRHAVS
jgi:FAD dependent oxidoreductase